MNTTDYTASLKQNAPALASQKASRNLGDNNKTYYGMEDNSFSSCGLKTKLS